MSISRIRKPMLIILSLLLALAVLGLARQPAAPASGGNAIALKAPSFISVANAQEGPAAAPMGFPQDEAGISAYFKSASPVTLADVRSVYRVIEVETADYIIGSVPVPNYQEEYDVHLYVHRDGWFLVYYLATDPAAKIFDWKDYANGARTEIRTKFDKAAVTVASLVGVPTPILTYYDFRYPNATQMMLIAEDENNGNEFTVKVPSSFQYYERSWGLYNTDRYYGSAWVLDGVTIASICDSCLGYGTLTASQLLPDATHTIAIDDYGGLALIYRVP